MNSAFLVVSRRNDDKQRAILLNRTMRDQFYHVGDTLGAMMTWNQKYGEEYAHRAQATYASARLAIITIST